MSFAVSSSNPETAPFNVLHDAGVGINEMTLMWKEQGMEMMETRISLMSTLLAGKRSIKIVKRREGSEEESNDHLGTGHETTGCGPYNRGG